MDNTIKSAFNGEQIRSAVSHLSLPEAVSRYSIMC